MWSRSILATCDESSTPAAQARSSRRSVALDTAWFSTVRGTSRRGGTGRKGGLRRRLSTVRARVGLVATVAVGLTLVIGGIGLIALLHQNLVNSLRGQAQLEAAQLAALAGDGTL